MSLNGEKWTTPLGTNDKYNVSDTIRPTDNLKHDNDVGRFEMNRLC